LKLSHLEDGGLMLNCSTHVSRKAPAVSGLQFIYCNSTVRNM